MFGDVREEFMVGREAVSRFEGEVRGLRTMQAEALAVYHEVRSHASEKKETAVIRV